MFFPKMPDNIGFLRKWNMFCIMFICSCLLVTRFFKEVPEVVDSAETLMWFGGGGLAIGLIVQFLKGRK
jgi:hypothetical protein